jgi:D-alanine--poly(phosphoribitol) ligase subunit 2
MDDLLAILQDLHPEVDYETCRNLVTGKIFDSFDIVTTIAEINDQFDITIPAEEITEENFDSADALYALIERLSEED